MKKLYSILGLCALFALPTFAQEEEDVTHFIVNPGFDIDLTFNEDGTTKEIVETGSLSSRSHKHVAADGTIYARTKLGSEGNGNWKRTDTEYSMNGFLGQIQGWTLETGSNGEWTYFGAVPYSLDPTSTTIGIADDNNNSWLTVAGKPEEADTEDNKATMYLRAGWTNYAAYSQVVSLPCAQYRLEYWINNMNFAGTNPDGLENLCKITCRQDVFPDDEGVNADGWTKHTIEFIPTAEFTITMGFRAANRGSGTNPILLIDGLKLYKIGEADRESLLQSDIMNYVDLITTYADENLSDNSGIIDEIQTKCEEFSDATAEGDLEAMQKIFNEAKAYYEALTTTVTESVQALNAQIEKAAGLLESETLYPGADDLTTALEDAQETLGNGTAAEIETGIAALEQAIDNYYMSQEATPENPADFTFYVDNPTFAAQGKWYIGEGGGDQTIKTDKTDNDGNPINCWNAWRNNLEYGNTLSINQDLTGLRNGKYTVTIDINTQDGCITNQHIFANGTADSAESPVMTITGWDPCVWETLTTTPVIVIDGKLTIGAIGVSDGDIPSNHGGTDTDKRRGWFNITNVKLNYLGEATAEEVAAVVAKKYADAEALASTMHFAADKAAFNEAIAAAKAESDLDALNAAIAEAKASETEYENILNGSYKDLKDNIAGETYSANAKKIAQAVVDKMDAYIASAEAAYKETPAMTEIQRIYRDTVIPALLAAENAEIADATGKAALAGTVASVAADLSTYTNDKDYLNECVARLNEAVKIAGICDIAYGAGADVTGYINNPNIDSESGWTFVKVVGNTNTGSGQEYNNGSSRYIDSWNGAGGTRHTGYQVIEVPNGKYKVSNIMRTSGTGAYLFASDKAPVTSEENVVTLDPTATSVISEAETVPTDKKYIDSSLEEASVIANDTYGEIWMAAADRVIAAMGITAAPADADGSRLYDLAVEKNGGESTCPEGVDAQDWAILGANGGKGRGWFNKSVEIEVKDHVLVIGATCDYVFVNKTEEEAFSGTWFSADCFKLTMIEAGDNTGWSPATGVQTIESANATASSIFSITGARVNTLQKGINIVKMSNGEVKKVLVK